MNTNSVLHLHLKKKYFDQIKAGEKTVEYRLYEKWHLKMRGKDYKYIHFYLGYPSQPDYQKKRIVTLFCGFKIETITHEEFGDEPVKVIAIKFTRIKKV